MKILVLGAAGMLGHRVYLTLREQKSDASKKIQAVVRKPASNYKSLNLFDDKDLVHSVNLEDTAQLKKLLDQTDPDLIINCAGVTTRKIKPTETARVVELNATLPHRLKNWCEINHRRLIHISTDCVFTGDQTAVQSPPYGEESITDAMDLYGRSKALGEVDGDQILTLRTSIVGLEIENRSELLEWFLSQKGKTINGFSKVIYSGVSTFFLARTIAEIVSKHKKISGIFQVASQPIAKYELLTMANRIFENNCTILPVEVPGHDKSLLNKKFLTATGIQTPDWETMLTEMKSARDVQTWYQHNDQNNHQGKRQRNQTQRRAS